VANCPRASYAPVTQFNIYISGSTRLQDFRAGLESENEISDLDDQLKKLSTAQDAEEDDSFGTVVIG
jgi:hypothetical protein